MGYNEIQFRVQYSSILSIRMFIPPRPHVVPPRQPRPIFGQEPNWPVAVVPVLQRAFLPVLPGPRPTKAPTVTLSLKSWNSKEEWIQWHQEKDIEREESHTQRATFSWEKELEANSDKLDLVSEVEVGQESADYIGTWTKWLCEGEKKNTEKSNKEVAAGVAFEPCWPEHWEDDNEDEEDEEDMKWEDEKTEQLNESWQTSSQTSCPEHWEDHDDNEEEYMKWEDEKRVRLNKSWQLWPWEDHDNDEKKYMKWEDEKRESWSETCWPKDCEDNNEKEYEVVMEEVVEEDKEEMIKRSREILQRHRKRCHRDCSESPIIPVMRHGKKGRSGTTRRSRRRSQQAKVSMTRVKVGDLLYSQKSIKEVFQCGQPISSLVQDLMDKKVSMSAHFLRLAVFESAEYDSKTYEPILVLRCIDNRRLFALKEYAKKSGKDRLMVNVELFNNYTLNQCKRFILNSDVTDGRDVRLRKNESKKKQPKQHRPSRPMQPRQRT